MSNQAVSHQRRPSCLRSRAIAAWLLTTILAACGGGGAATTPNVAAPAIAEPTATAPVTAAPAVTVPIATTNADTELKAALSVGIPQALTKAQTITQGEAGAAYFPEVERLNLVATNRISRTQFDYTFVLTVRGNTKNYSSGAFTATTDAPGTVVIDGAVETGPIEAMRSLRPSDTITLRQDRQFAFDKSRLKFSFAGVIADSSIANAGPSFGKVAFYRESGRAGHAAILPIRSENPVAGDTLYISATIMGNATSATYRLSDLTGAQLNSGNLARPNASSDKFSTVIQVPSVPFKIEIVAANAGAIQKSWRSNPYYPSTIALKITTALGIFDPGVSLNTTIEITSNTASGPQKVSIHLPEALSSTRQQWDVAVTPGQKVTIPVTIDTSKAASQSSYNLVAAIASTTSPGLPAVEAYLKILAR